MIIIGEKINGAIPSTAKAIAAKDGEFIKNLAKIQTEAGVDYIDVCASVDDDIELETMKWL
ncbi:methyltetrahydrofolate cobalamin methyltransferase, partial [Candidatus Nomurabacteria bacterium]|nr:methyltetrahydrofolate cobalamin methyltransferase [Candidatus Nomurabacteria bacterium]